MWWLPLTCGVGFTAGCSWAIWRIIKRAERPVPLEDQVAYRELVMRARQRAAEVQR